MRCIALWAIAGDRLSLWMRSPGVLKGFNYAMASLLAATAGWILFDEALAN